MRRAYKWSLIAALVTGLAVAGAYGYRPLAYYVVSVHEQHGKPSVWTDAATGELLQHPVSYHIEYRKRYDWLPGSDVILGGISKHTYERMRHDAVAVNSWDNEKTFGKAYYFVKEPVGLDGKPENVRPIQEDVGR